MTHSDGRAEGIMTKNARRLVVFVSDFPFSPRDEVRFGLSFFVSRGYTPIIVNVAQIYPPTGAGWQGGDLSSFPSQDMRSSKDLRESLRGIASEDLVINLVGLQRGHLRRYRELHQVLSESRGTMGGLDAAPVMPPERPKQTRSSFTASGVDLVRAMRSWLISLSVVRSLFRFIYGIRPLDFAWVATSADNLSPLLIGKETRVVPIHSLDFDRICVAQVAQKKSTARLILIDDLGPDHPDLQRSDDAPRHGLSTGQYFTELRSNLDQIELLSGCLIEVAAHPRARPGVLEERYGHRQIHYGETAKLIEQSSLILLTGASTAVGMGIALKKPMMMIQIVGIDETRAARRDAIVDFLKLETFMVGHTKSGWQWPVIDAGAYDSYMAKFVKIPGSREGHFWQVVIDTLEDQWA